MFKLKSYNFWEGVDSKDNPSAKNFFGSGGGTFFDPSKIDKGILSNEVFSKICPLGDDIWLNAFTRLSNQKTFVVNGKSAHILNIQIANDQRLFDDNCNKNQNDIQIRDVREYARQTYGKDPFRLK